MDKKDEWLQLLEQIDFIFFAHSCKSQAVGYISQMKSLQKMSIQQRRLPYVGKGRGAWVQEHQPTGRGWGSWGSSANNMGTFAVESKWGAWIEEIF